MISYSVYSDDDTYLFSYDYDIYLYLSIFSLDRFSFIFLSLFSFCNEVGVLTKRNLNRQ